MSIPLINLISLIYIGLIYIYILRMCDGDFQSHARRSLSSLSLSYRAPLFGVLFRVFFPLALSSSLIFLFEICIAMAPTCIQ